MISRWSIRRKLFLGIVLLFVAVTALSISSFIGINAFRSLAKSLRLRAPELTMGSQLAQDVSKLRVTYKLYQESSSDPGPMFQGEGLMTMDALLGIDDILVGEFRFQLDMVLVSFKTYSTKLTENRSSDEYRKLGVYDEEQLALDEFDNLLTKIQRQSREGLPDLNELAKQDMPSQVPGATTDSLDQQLERLEKLSKDLPHHLHSSLENFADDVRLQYRSWMVANGVIALVALTALLLMMRMFYSWVLRPLEILVRGSRRVASGDFEHRIKLDSEDEIAELASAMNGMTLSFREIRDDLNQKVQQRTQEVVRSEQLASVGFLAAGVAHEINNPLASIALCAESLEQRIAEEEILQTDDSEPSVVLEYLKMIQDEAFRCKEITERLLDFSRLGDVEKHQTDLTALVSQVIGMIKHLGKYKEKDIEFRTSQTVFASVNAQEIKQVVLNLLTNALDSLNPGGKVTVTLNMNSRRATIVVQDNGCGMTPEVQKNLFEPFFTRRRDGQGTGLGMSITYRIVNDHGGDIVPHSAGPGTGSTFTVSLPLTSHDEKQSKIRTAA